MDSKKTQAGYEQGHRDWQPTGLPSKNRKLGLQIAAVATATFVLAVFIAVAVDYAESSQLFGP